MARRPDGRAYLVAGASGSGKSAWTLQQCSAAPRLLVWDPLGEWSDRCQLKRANTMRDLRRLVAAGLKTGARIGYTGPIYIRYAKGKPVSMFTAFCRFAWIWLREAPGVLVVEELSDVSPQGKAPLEWGEIVRKGRHLGAVVYALTQRPAESDKTILSNAAVIHTGMMAFDDDRVYMAKCLGVPVADIAALAELEFIERNMRTRDLTRGKVTFTRRRRTG